MSERTLSAKAVAYAASRKISRKTLDRMGVGSATEFFPELNRKAEGLIFDYSGQWKARAIEDKAFVSQKGFEIEFWNLRNVLNSPSDEVYITEGEIDALSLVEAGIPFDEVLSVPNGARAREARNGNGHEPDLTGYDFVREALEAGLKHKSKFVFCGDNDNAGLSLRSDMARLVGAARYHFVEWPDGCKDANEVLRAEGGDFLLELAVEGSLPWPVPGLYRMSQLPEPEAMTVWSTGFMEWDRKVMLAPRTLSVATGQPGHGKTLLFGQVFFQITRRYNLVACIASFETRPKPHLRKQLRSLYAHAKGSDKPQEWLLTDVEREEADQFIEDHYRFIVHPEQRPTLGWLLDTAEVAVVRDGCKIVQLDPWNRLEAMREGGETDVQYIERCLRELHSFANDLGCHVQIIAHPAKMEGKRRKFPPELEDIAGAKAWDAMVDQGFTVHRPKVFHNGQRRTEADLYHRKARFEELGYQCKLSLNYKLDTRRYEISTGTEENQNAEEEA